MKRFSILAMMYLLVTGSAMAATSAPKTGTDSLRHFFREVNSFSARFKQVVLDETQSPKLLIDCSSVSEEASAEVVLASVLLKAGVVERDEFEGGFREVLNFGHTIGHALEAASEYSMGHGSAVAAGMLAESRMGERMGVTRAGTTDRLTEVLRRAVGTPAPSGSEEAARGYLASDKKAREGRPRYVLLDRIGKVSGDGSWSREVPDALVEEALASLYYRP